MPNEENLIPIQALSKEEAKKRGSAGGKASVASRRRKKTMKQVMEFLLEQPANTVADYNFLVEQGLNLNELDEDFVNNMLVVNAALLKAAKEGDVSAIKELRSVIQDDAYLKQKIKYENAKIDIERAKSQPPQVKSKEYSGIPASLIAPTFAPVLFDIKDSVHSEYVFPGGRGSTKSSFAGLNVIDILMEHDDMHACVLRNIGNTLKDSVYSQILWAISALGLDDEFAYTKSPLEITRITTGQKIYFRGADDPNKIKSIKPPFGYIGVVWFEELDQFAGEEAVRKIEQSVIRGGDIAYKFKTFNPPKSANNWANKYIKIPREDRLVVESNYLNVPKKWLGKTFLDDAEFLKETNPTAYENEYLGIANGTGGNVFDNVIAREITDEEISHFDRVYNGIDWGWYPDLFAFVRVHYEPSQHTLYIWQEYTCNKKSNRQTADKLIEMGITGNDIITCDSAENKSVGDYKAYGLLARSAIKGPGSREYSYKWLQSLKEIVIDNSRCPEACEEFFNYEYERDKEGNVISGYPDGNDHVIDAVRYATERLWRKKGV
ncbi:MAG: PBSX family phage terminase large subunit [Oscillospiraceae bacterium]